MRVLKFGGTSVGSAERMKSVAQIINDGVPKVVVLSAMSGTTNTLVELSDYLKNKNTESANELILKLEKHYEKTVDELYAIENYKEKGKKLIKQHFDYIRTFTRSLYKDRNEKIILAQGEQLSTALFQYYLEEQGHKSALLSALCFMRVDKAHEPDEYYIQENIKREIALQPDCDFYITQGFICRTAYGEIDNLQRGGSDYSASLMGAAIDADEIQIWTDIDGFHNNDPRVVNNTKPIPQLSFDEAAELAYFGAKIMHPSSILPAKLKNIPVRLKNTLAPKEAGTVITADFESVGIRAVAAKNGITAVKVKSGRMLMAYGFLRKVFEVFEIYETPIDMITTSEVAVSVTIDDTKNLEKIEKELKKYGQVELDRDQSIVCVVGNFGVDRAGLASQLFNAVQKIPIRMISYGGSRYNISMVVKEKHKAEILQALSDNLLANN